MLSFRQTAFQAVLVFGVGVGLGLAWKAGLIPVELGSANTGSVKDEESAELDVSGELLEPTTPALIPTSTQRTVPEVPSADTELFTHSPPVSTATTSSAAPPERLDRTVWPSAKPHIRSAPDADQVTTAAHRDEPEWATGPAVNRADRVQTAAATERTNEPYRRAATEVRQVANQEPPGRLAGESATESRSGSNSLEDQLAAIDEQIVNNEMLPAHRALSKLYWNHKDARRKLVPRLEQTAKSVFFEPQPHYVDPYVVQPNDKLTVIASKYQVSWEYIKKLNRIDPRRIQSGQKLKIVKGPFAAVVDLGDYALTIHLQGYFVRRYQVGIGKDGASPIGKFAVINKVENPQYTGPDGKVIPADDPSNPLGERWIDLGESYGIHGTIEPDSVGKAASRGCIRMREKDVIEVYDFLVKGSEVVIRK